MRIVLDTCILFDALFENCSHAQSIIRMHNNKQIDIVGSEEIYIEWYHAITGYYLEVLLPTLTVDNPAKHLEKKINTIYLLVCSSEKIKVKSKKKLSPHDSDNKFINCAIDANADFILSKNSQHLNILSGKIKNADKKDIRIITPVQFNLMLKYSGNITF